MGPYVYQFQHNQLIIIVYALTDGDVDIHTLPMATVEAVGTDSDESSSSSDGEAFSISPNYLSSHVSQPSLVLLILIDATSPEERHPKRRRDKSHKRDKKDKKDRRKHKKAKRA